MQKWLKNLLLLSVMTLGMINIGHADDGQTNKVVTPNFKNVIEFEEDFNELSIDYLIEEIQESIDEGDKVINIGLNSPGGSIFAGNRLIHKLFFWQSQGIKFNGIVREWCASMCFMTLQLLDGRYVYPFAMLMDHPAQGGGLPSLFEISELLRLQVKKRLIAAGKTKLEIHLYNLLVLQNFYINSNTAMALGLIDKIIVPGAERKLLPKKEKKNVKVQPKPAASK